MKLPKNFGGQGFGSMMQQAKAAMARAQQLEEELKVEQVLIDKGPVKAVFNGTGELLKLSISKEVVNPEEIDILEDLVVSCIRDGFEQATALRDQKVKQIVPNIPGL